MPSKSDFDLYESEEPLMPQASEKPFSVQQKARRLKAIIIFQWFAILFLSIVCIILLVYKQRPVGNNPNEVHSPARHLVSYKNLVYSASFGAERTPYQGPPTPERDALWEQLYDFGISRISREDAIQMVNKTVPIPNDAGKYVISLDVFHQLHCLNMIRKRLYATEQYAPDHELLGMEHIEHCYDTVRQSLMCSSDITPLPWKWVEEDHEAKEVAAVMHTCRDFEAIRNWAKENRISHFDTSIYVPNDLI